MSDKQGLSPGEATYGRGRLLVSFLQAIFVCQLTPGVQAKQYQVHPLAVDAVLVLAVCTAPSPDSGVGAAVAHRVMPPATVSGSVHALPVS